MNPGVPRTLLDRHRARLLARWRERLRALPPSSALATPEVLGPLMAPALSRVREETGRMPPSIAEPAGPEPCRCGLNPLLAFYLTGECATFDVLWSRPDGLVLLSGAERERICRALSRAWRRVAADEIALFCGACRHGAALADRRGERRTQRDGDNRRSTCSR